MAEDFGVHTMTLQKWLQRAAIGIGDKPGQTRTEGRSYVKHANGFGSWSRRTRCCGVRRRICRRHRQLRLGRLIPIELEAIMNASAACAA